MKCWKWQHCSSSSLLTALKLPGLILISVNSQCSPIVCRVSCNFLPPTFQKHSARLISHGKLSLCVNICTVYSDLTPGVPEISSGLRRTITLFNILTKKFQWTEGPQVLRDFQTSRLNLQLKFASLDGLTCYYFCMVFHVQRHLLWSHY